MKTGTSLEIPDAFHLGLNTQLGDPHNPPCS